MSSATMRTVIYAECREQALSINYTQNNKAANMLSATMCNCVTMLSVFMLNVTFLSVMAPKQSIAVAPATYLVQTIASSILFSTTYVPILKF